MSAELNARKAHPELASVLYVQKSPIDEVNIGQILTANDQAEN
jgi:hypothetical protein